MSNYAKADTRSQWYADNYPGATIKPNCGVIHTTEGTDWPSYSGGAVAPNYTAKPDFAGQRLIWRAHFPDEMSSRALQNLSGGVETNTANAAQVELIGTCDPRAHASWKTPHIYWPEAPEWALLDLAAFIADMNKRHGIKITGPATWRAYPSSYGATDSRLTFDEWRKFYGWCGHQHVPENVHGDPGSLPWAKVAEMARNVVGPEPVPQPNARRLTLGTFNLLRGRSPATVLREVLALVDRHQIDALAVQEAEGYFEALSRLKDFDYFCDPDNPENGLLVVEGRGSDFYSHDIGDGWTRKGGARRGPGEFPRVTVDGWCRVGSTHWPPSTNWRDGKLVAPRERVDDVQEWAEACQRFLSRDKGTSVLLGDNNERATTKGQWSPGWVAEQTGARIGSTGGIDWGLVVNGHFENVLQSNVAEKSDHEPQVMDVVES